MVWSSHGYFDFLIVAIFDLGKRLQKQPVAGEVGFSLPFLCCSVT